jgi:hypothetical protein
VDLGDQELGRHDIPSILQLTSSNLARKRKRKRKEKKNYVQSKAQLLKPYSNPLKDGFILELHSLTPARKAQQKAAA